MLNSGNIVVVAIIALIVFFTIVLEIIVVFTSLTYTIPVIGLELNFYAISIREAVEDPLLELFLIYIFPLILSGLLVLLKKYFED